MNCTNIINKINYISPGVTDGDYNRLECGGEMIVVGDTFSIETDNEGKIANKRTLYQCEICKTIQLI